MSPALRPFVLAACVAYFVAIVIVAAWAGRRTRSAGDFFVAGRRIGLVVAALATMSAAFSGFLFIGGPGLTWRLGAGSLFIVLPVGFTSGLLCWSVARRLRLLAEIDEIYTIPDAIRRRFGSPAAQAAAAVAILAGTVGYLAAQILALGVISETVFSTRDALGTWSLPVVTVAGMLVVLAYSTAGGMLAGVYTDVVQGGLMLVAAGGVLWCALSATGGPSRLVGSIAADPRFGPAFLEPFGRAPAATGLGLFFVFSIGTLGQPHLLHKFLMLRDPRDLRAMPAVLGASQSLCIVLWLAVGLAVPALVAQGAMAPLTAPDDATPAFVARFTPPLLAGIVFAGAIAAIMSTADSLVNIGAAALVRDLPRAAGRRVPDELRSGRLATAGLMLAATVLALAWGDLVALLGTPASGIFPAALAPALAVGLHWKRVGPRAATASIVCGLAVHLALESLARLGTFSGTGAALPGVVPGALALAVSFLVLLGVAMIERDGAADRDEPLRTVLDA